MLCALRLRVLDYMEAREPTARVKMRGIYGTSDKAKADISQKAKITAAGRLTERLTKLWSRADFAIWSQWPLSRSV